MNCAKALVQSLVEARYETKWLKTKSGQNDNWIE